MRLKRLTLRGFRGFEELELDLDRDVTVLVGVNGAGKSSILDAIAIMLSRVAGGILTGLPQNGRKLRDADVHVERSFANLEMVAQLGPYLPAWRVTHARPGGVRVPTVLAMLKAATDHVRDEFQPTAASLGLAVYYPVNRAVLDVPSRIRTRHAFEPFEAFDQALEGGERNFRVFFEWFRAREDLENQLNARRPSQRHVDPQLEAVRVAVKRLSGLEDLHVERSPQRMLVRKGGVELAVEQLSDGEKCVLAMVGDLARRLAIANPNAAQPLDCEAVVLIDEIDLHLHPAWERTILPSLQRTFPKCQFVVSTHSPHVVATAPRGSVVMLHDFRPFAPPTPTHGRAVSSILGGVFDVPERPDDVAASLRAIDEALTAGRMDAARAGLAAWSKQLGSDDPDIVRLETMMHFLGAGPDADDPEAP